MLQIYKRLSTITLKYITYRHIISYCRP